MELDELIITAVSRKLLSVKINQIEKTLMVITVKGKDHIDNLQEVVHKIQSFTEHLNESNKFIEQLINAA